MKISNILQSLFPTVCAICGAITENPSVHICNSCYKSLPFRRGFFIWGASRNDGFRYCSGVFCPLYYRDMVPALIADIKFHGRRDTASIHGALLAQMLLRSSLAPTASGGAPAVLVPIPLHRDRYRRRGYNQAETIAAQVSAATGIALAPDLLLRGANTPAQHLRNRRERMEMAAVFAASPRAAGKVVVLVDDVITTGATMEAAAHALLRQGAKAVYYAAAAGNLPLSP